jgi:hypothetical protein
MRQQLLSGKAVATGRYWGRESPPVSQSLGVCLDCIRRDFEKVRPLLKKPTTSAHHAREALEAASAQGLRRVMLTEPRF